LGGLPGESPPMTALRVAQVITRCVRGGAYQVVRALLDRLPREDVEQTLVAGPEAAPAGALVVPELVRDIDPRRDAAALVRHPRRSGRPQTGAAALDHPRGAGLRRPHHGVVRPRPRPAGLAEAVAGIEVRRGPQRHRLRPLRRDAPA